MYVSDCFLESLSNPRFHAHSKRYYGSWMRDPIPRFQADDAKRWATQEFYGNLLYEYADEAEMRREKANKRYVLPTVFDGTNHVFVNGSLYYHRSGTNKIAKFDIYNRAYTEVELPNMAYRYDHYLFNYSYNYVDLSHDENGLWAIYRYEGDLFLGKKKI